MWLACVGSGTSGSDGPSRPIEPTESDSGITLPGPVLPIAEALAEVCEAERAVGADAAPNELHRLFLDDVRCKWNWWPDLPTPAADEILVKNGKRVTPDILANAGGVTVSYFEWVQNKAGYYWGLPEVHDKLKKIMEPEGRRVFDVHLEKGIDMRTAAYVHALERIATAVEAHGTKAYFAGSR